MKVSMSRPAACAMAISRSGVKLPDVLAQLVREQVVVHRPEQALLRGESSCDGRPSGLLAQERQVPEHQASGARPHVGVDELGLDLLRELVAVRALEVLAHLDGDRRRRVPERVPVDRDARSRAVGATMGGMGRRGHERAPSSGPGTAPRWPRPGTRMADGPAASVVPPTRMRAIEAASAVERKSRGACHGTMVRAAPAGARARRQPGGARAIDNREHG